MMYTTARHSRLIPWIAAFTFMVSLISPMLTLAAPDDNPFDDPPPTATQAPPTCAEGEILTPNNVCIPDPNQQQPPDCPDGQVPNGNGGCMPDPDQQPTCPDGQGLDDNGNCQPLPPPPCPAGTHYDEQGNCVPDQPPTCPEGEILSANNVCVPDPNAQPPGCEAGQVLDDDGNCIPEPEPLPTCPEGTVFNELSGECESVEESAPPPVEEEPAPPPDLAPTDEVPTEAPDSTTSITAALTAELVTHPVEIVKYVCPDGTDRRTTLAELRSACTPAADVDFNLIVQIFDVSITTSTTDPSGAVTFAEVPDLSTIQESVPDGYGDPIVFCGDRESSTRLAQVPSDDGAIEAGPRFSSDLYTCDWFNIPGDQPLITVHTFNCPGTPGLFLPDHEEEATPLTLADFQRECPDPGDGVQFTLEQGDLRSWLITVSGKAIWRNVPAGSFTLTETIPEDSGTPVWFCGFDSGTPTRREAPGGVLSSVIGPDDRELTCMVFNPVEIPFVPAGSIDEPGEVTGDHIIEIDKFRCPAGTDSAAALDDLRTLCTAAPDIEFTVSAGGTSTALTTDAAGNVLFSGIPNGPFAIQETVPESFGDPVAWCGFRLSDGGFDSSPAPGGLLEGEFVTEEDLHCQWFNFSSSDIGPGGTPADTGESDETGPSTSSVGRVILHYHVCPSGTDLSVIPESATEGPEGCTGQQDGVAFQLVHDGAVVETRNTGDDGPSQVTFESVPTGELTLVQPSPPPGDKVVFCQISSPSGNTRPYGFALLVESSWSFELEPGEIAFCDWYVTSEESGNTGRIVIQKGTCPDASIDPALGREALNRLCSREGGITFRARGADGYDETLVSSTSGTVIFRSVPAGHVTITETIPPGYREPFVFCHLSTHADGSPVPMTSGGQAVAGGSITTEVRDAHDLNCGWFNVPLDGGDEEGSSTVTVNKWRCPEGFDFAGILVDDLPAACPDPMDSVEFTLTDTAGPHTQTTFGGVATWANVPNGDHTIKESVPLGNDPHTFVSCAVNDGERHLLEVTDAMLVLPSITAASTEIECDWYNVLFDGRTIGLEKWTCPAGTDTTSILTVFDECGPIDGDVEFSLTDGNGTVTTSTIGGTVNWYGVTPGEITIAEHTPPGYHDPVAWCMPREALLSPLGPLVLELGPYAVTDSSITIELPDSNSHWACLFVNVSKGLGELTIHKFTCPAGYDVDAPSADPTVDCTEVTSGVEFTLEYLGVIDTSTTGETTPGAVRFGELDPGSYTITETLPDNIDGAFVWDCTGTDIGSVHPTPLSRGDVLNVDVAGGDSIVCDWYNVPEAENGRLVVQKYECSTVTFISDIDCNLYERGAEFELYSVDPDALLSTFTTGPSGDITFHSLPDGRYRIEEVGQEPCHVDITREDGAGVALVTTGEYTRINVYNCVVETTAGTPTTTGTPGLTTTTTSTGKIPVKYPDTGADPVGDDVTPRQQGAPGATATPSTSSDGFYDIACLSAPITASGTPVPAGTSLPDGGCQRGAVPTHLLINDASVNADIEVVEIVNGIMQPPTNPHVAAWYKETARLGENSNTIIAGHLNWWNVPEGVFFRLDELEEGDRIEITGDDGLTYVYEVQWVRLEPNGSPPSLEVVGPTASPSLTLITCGGDWDAAAAEYDSRTVVRAVQVDIQPANPDT